MKIPQDICNIKYSLCLTAILIIFFNRCSKDDNVPNDTTSSIIWSGATKSFAKQDGASPEDQINQDRLTPKVWITRGNNGGQIYNKAIESSSDKAESPSGTEWSIGKIGEIESLIFTNFRIAVGKPQTVVGKDLVLHLIEEDIYLSVKFTSWSGGKKGGFAYDRSTP
ncbi:MAG: hypothetical protein CMD29_05640 [Flavobacteriales bacterium]|nr:hypothetical protein [Flavobacteriales bacterium]|tara:strand:+ start:1547 stop:2047 length:501 start_codon:yes stop_codon:yes gene_type:complete